MQENTARRDWTFPLLEDVIVVADAAMRAKQPAKIVDALVRTLPSVLANAGALPPEVLAPDPRGYLRREAYRSERFGYQVLLLTWGPGQASPVHDHGDTWGVEAVLRGRLDVVDYRVRHREQALAELQPRGGHSLVDGQIIGLLPPHDLHLCRNPDPRGAAVSLHVYGEALHDVTRFVPIDDAGWFRPERVRLESA